MKEVRTVRTSSTLGNNSSEYEPVLGDYLNVLTQDCSRINESSSYDLEHCVHGGKLTLTPTHDPQSPSETLTWCLENRIFRDSDGNYPKPRWEKDAPLFIQFKVCE